MQQEIVLRGKVCGEVYATRILDDSKTPITAERIALVCTEECACALCKPDDVEKE
jgi:hypothetical protein